MVLFVTLRSKKSKKETLIISEEDVRENVVTYDDEGGGEEDTEAFDMAALRNPEAAAEARKKRKRRKEEAEGKHEAFGAVGAEPQSPSLSLPVEDMQEVIQLKVVEADQDTSGPPYDSLQTYAYEGQGSPTGSISSLDLPPYEPDTPDLNASWPDVHSLATLFQERSGQRTL